MKKFLFTPLFGLFLYNAIAQTPESLLKKVQEQYTTEKIYLHYDKAFYVAGETIWFKAYFMEGYLPATKSTVMSVELLNDSGRVVDKKILPITGSAAIGEFNIPKTLPQGNYTVKAFTRNLMNFGYEHFYYHQLNIQNPATKVETPAPAASYAVNFFPEAGNIVGNVKNTIAFKCTDQFGKPREITGVIKDGAGKEITSFKSLHDGMGTFELNPRSGEKYSADCLIEGQKNNYSLPAALAEGVMLNIIRKENKMFFRLDATMVVNENLVPDYILGVQENLVAFKVPVPNQARALNGEIPASQLPTGILQLTVFNKQHKPLAERLVFINSGDYIPGGNFKNEVVNLKARGKNSYSFDLEDTIAGSFSVSVTEAEVETKLHDNILSHLLLTADIKGLVYHPAYYFESNDEMHQSHLDLVMLTNGWRRYSWNELLSNRFPGMRFKDPGFISISAQAFNPYTNKPLSNTDLMVIAKTNDQKTNFLSVGTDSIGNLLMEGMTFEDTAKLSFRSNNTKVPKVNIKYVSPGLSNIFYSLKTPIRKQIPETPDDKLKLKLQDHYAFNKLNKFDGILLDEIKVKAKIKSEKEKYETKYVSGRMGSSANKTLDLISEPTTSSQNVFNYLQSRLTGVTISGGPLNYSLVYRNAMSMSGGQIQMALFLDEFPVDPIQIATMSISRVAMVKVFPSGGLSGGPGGALAIYTKKGDMGVVNSRDDLQELLVEGFSPTKEFFSPNYADAADENIVTDDRMTLYWNPYLISNAENRSVKFSFYNSDKAKKFKVILEGIMQDGKLLHIEKLIE